MLFKGSIVAVVTPFKNGRLDLGALRALTRWHLDQGTHGIVVNGTTGESPTTTADEQDAAVRTVLAAVRGRIPVIAGVGTNDTEKTVAQARRAEKLGANGLLVVSPYYNRPVQEGLYRHFAAVAKAVKVPLVIYNIPGRTGVAVAADTMARLMAFKNVAAVKDASGDLRFAMDLRAKIGARLAILSGEDPLNLPLASVGSCGAISVVANVVPRRMADMYEAVFDNDFARAAGIHLEILDLHKGLFVETNPIPVKAALCMMGKIGPEIRLPLTPLSKDKAAALRLILKRHGLIKKC
ncbi:MAG: 4-hydroxy-tetrahydrodipicolinate synthase [Deltaproteobacteria bacterium]|nr:4-hydroxy-tetrahydrodipicolinate synthase [Deltaproteobacteria bacterium]